MKLLRGFENPADYRGGYVTIGNFDGVHRGHQSLVSALVDRARTAGVSACILTFDPHPIELLRPQQAPPSLNTVERKAGLLGKLGVDCVIAYPTDRELLDLSPQEFFSSIIQQELQAKGLVEGPNFCFGKNRSGDISTLEKLCEETGLRLDVVPSLQMDGEIVSSSVVRTLLSEGKIEHAVELLGHPYRIHGLVVRGDERGRSIGFPTANLDKISTLLPADGVYAGIAHVVGQSFAAAINIGPNPTFGAEQRKIEAHLLDFSGDLYGQQVDLDILQRVRDIQKFSGVNELCKQLRQDVEQVRTLVANSPPTHL